MDENGGIAMRFLLPPAGWAAVALLVVWTAGCSPRASAPLNQAAGWAKAATDLSGVPATPVPRDADETPWHPVRHAVTQAALQADANHRQATLQLTTDRPTPAPPASPTMALAAPVLRVPLGWQVTVALDNPLGWHSAMLVQYPDLAAGPRSDSAIVGRGATGRTQSILFKARTPGRYAVVCATPGHHHGVMAVLDVQAEADRPALEIRPQHQVALREPLESARLAGNQPD
ncbi:MAG: hypothetical protein K6T31_07010 [Alicyclobacillus sp.]|nr:hypothetical protein [Alicyclobacillus sp.]